MNKCSFIGNVSREPEIRYVGTDSTTAVAKFSLAVGRKFKKEGESDADFINCVSFGKISEIIEKYVNKGSKIGIVARVQCGNYTNKEGIKVYTTDFIVEELDLLGKKESGDNQGNQQAGNNGDYMEIPETDMESLPFN